MKERMENIINEKIKSLIDLTQDDEYFNKINITIETIVNSLKSGGKLLVCGNGGSAADAQHIAAEFVGRFVLERPGYPAIALTTDSSNLTAIGNDYSFDDVFSRQVEALGNKGDVLIAISTSGNSKNVVNAIEMAKKRNMKIIGLSGKDGGLMKDLCDICFVFPYKETARIQEQHMMTYHMICEFSEQKLKENNYNE